MSGKDENPKGKESPATSPYGDVNDEEMLARFVNLERANLVNNKRILAGALKTSQLMPPSDGWSFCRQDHAASMSEKIKQHAKTKTSGQRYGYASVRALDVRQIRDKEDEQEITDKSGKQSFCVVANPVKDNHEHALVKRAGDDYTTEQLRYIRDELLKKFSDVKTG